MGQFQFPVVFTDGTSASGLQALEWDLKDGKEICDKENNIEDKICFWNKDAGTKHSTNLRLIQDWVTKQDGITRTIIPPPHTPAQAPKRKVEEAQIFIDLEEEEEEAVKQAKAVLSFAEKNSTLSKRVKALESELEAQKVLEAQQLKMQELFEDQPAIFNCFVWIQKHK